MSMRPESYAHIWDALQAVRALRRFTQGVSEEEYLSDLMLSSAVERQIEILGEALNREGYSQPRRPLVFAQVRDRLPRPVNKPHCLCAHLLRVGERCPFARRRLRSPQWVPRGPPFGFAPAERAQAPLRKVVRGQSSSCGPIPGREYRRRPWSPPLSGSPLGGHRPTPQRHSYRPEQVSAPPRLHPEPPGLD